jgi:hypothetical protein
LPIAEVLHDALDIPPHQSQSKWVGYNIQLPEKQDKLTEEKQFPISVAALDVNDKFLVVLQIPMTLSELRTVGVHPIVEMLVFETYRVREIV